MTVREAVSGQKLLRCALECSQMHVWRAFVPAVACPGWFRLSRCRVIGAASGQNLAKRAFSCAWRAFRELLSQRARAPGGFGSASAAPSGQNLLKRAFSRLRRTFRELLPPRERGRGCQECIWEPTLGRAGTKPRNIDINGDDLLLIFASTI